MEYKIIYSAKIYGNWFSNITLIHLEALWSFCQAWTRNCALSLVCILIYREIKNQCGIHGIFHIFTVFRWAICTRKFEFYCLTLYPPANNVISVLYTKMTHMKKGKTGWADTDITERRWLDVSVLYSLTMVFKKWHIWRM